MSVHDRGVRQRVLREVERADDGLPRLRALPDAWIDYLDTVDRGWFFFAAATEFDGRTGLVRDANRRRGSHRIRTLAKQIWLACRLVNSPRNHVEQLIFARLAWTPGG